MTTTTTTRLVSSKTLMLAALAGTFGLLSFGDKVEARPPQNGQIAGPTLTLKGVFRDFRKNNQPGGHPDFGRNPNAGEVHTMGNVASTLDADGKPVFTGNGQVCLAEWRDAQGRAIHPSLYTPSKGDIAGASGSPDDGAIQDANSYRQWYRDVPGYNVSNIFTMEMSPHPSGTGWLYDDSLPTNQAIIGGGTNANFEYSLDLDLQFMYQKNANQFITVGGRDDIFVFVDGQLVADLGGVNHGERQTISFDRLNLQNGQLFDLKIFMTERIKQKQDLYLEISFDVWNGELPTTSGMYD